MLNETGSFVACGVFMSNGEACTVYAASEDVVGGNTVSDVFDVDAGTEAYDSYSEQIAAGDVIFADAYTGEYRFITPLTINNPTPLPDLNALKGALSSESYSKLGNAVGVIVETTGDVHIFYETDTPDTYRVAVAAGGVDPKFIDNGTPVTTDQVLEP